MRPEQLAFVVAMGTAFIALGLIPGPLWEFREALLRFGSLLSPFVWKVPLALHRREAQRLPGQEWLAVMGTVFIVLGVLGYLAL